MVMLKDYNSFPLASQANLFGGLEEGLLSARAEALAAVDMKQSQSGLSQFKHDMMYHHHHPSMTGHPPPNHRSHQMSHEMDGLQMLDPIGSSSMATLAPMSDAAAAAAAASVTSHSHPQFHSSMYSHQAMNSMMGTHPSLTHPHVAMGMHDSESDPRELEAFAERFKQRRIKLGVTQADVGRALANLKLPGVGALSQSTICRFESLTLSHNNMVALKPVLAAWLEAAEAEARRKDRDPDGNSVLPGGEKKRKRTSIAAPEKRSLEAYFAVQPRPSGEKIAAIAEKLDLKKNVVRVWFCNQRQKQKRMKFAAQH
ncbi:unnamed protein product [Darwinula stevensoni]|uniref:POU domain protein n=1 Tax=Darwinula stevensoni TaxID=69355 RepID=A0A7R8WZK8_9CRUS|nr:unnamed protein product [Darwinula stevensoni]CAG0880240.1 unnamed protein product [Darwinula stevensoni]